MSARTVDVAYEYLKVNKGGISFKELWANVITALKYNDAQAARKISQFYTDLSLDGRFVSLEGNKWDLKSNRKYEDVIVEDEFLDDGDEVEVDVDDMSPDIEDYN